jgi:hypothetical protein
VTIRPTAALITLLALLIAPLLPPAHLHRRVTDVGHVHTLIHRHFAPHTTEAGAHLGGSGVPEGAPQWHDAPWGAMPQLPSIAADTTVPLFSVPNPPQVDVKFVPPPSDVSIHSPPRSPAGLRAPPHEADPALRRRVSSPPSLRQRSSTHVVIDTGRQQDP